MSIRRKFIVFIGVSVAIIFCVGLVSGFFFFYLPRLDAVGDNQARLAEQLSASIAEIIDEKIRNFPTILALAGHEERLRGINASYKDRDPEEIDSRMRAMDEVWRKDESDALWQYLDPVISEDLKKIQAEQSFVIGELLVTDTYGGLVASSGRTSDYYQADEAWWQEAFAAGLGRIFIGEVEYDKSTDLLAIPLAFPLRDAAQRVIGVCKVVVDINAFFNILKNFEQGEGVRVAILNSDNRIIYHEGVVSLNQELTEFADLETSAKRWKIVDACSLHPGRGELFLAYSKVSHPWFLSNGLRWKIVVTQDKAVILRPLHFFLLKLFLVEILLLLFLVIFAFIFATRSVAPLEKLSRATELVASGKLGCQVDIRTGDEIEQLAQSFNKMTEALQRTNQERIRAEMDLKKALKIKGEFTSTVSHELKTPLAAIREGVQLVVDGSLGSVNSDQKDCLEIVKGNIERLVRLIGDILDFQKLESGRMTFHMRPNNLNALIDEIARMMAFEAKKKGLDLKVSLDKTAPSSTFDRDKIAQVLSNVLSNAIKFTEQGTVSIRSAYRTDYLLVSIEDTGAGIRQEDIPKLFQRYAQIAEHGYRKTGGTGLGLVISREIIKHHNGKIWIEAKPKGGTIVSFTLPV